MIEKIGISHDVSMEIDFDNTYGPVKVGYKHNSILLTEEEMDKIVDIYTQKKEGRKWTR